MNFEDCDDEKCQIHYRLDSSADDDHCITYVGEYAVVTDLGMSQMDFLLVAVGLPVPDRGYRSEVYKVGHEGTLDRIVALEGKALENKIVYRLDCDKDADYRQVHASVVRAVKDGSIFGLPKSAL